VLLRDLVEGPDHEFVSATLQCCICACEGTVGGTYRINKKSMKSTGNLRGHFSGNHGEWWAEVERLENCANPQPPKPAVEKPVDVSYSIKALCVGVGSVH